jgi:4-hydroxybenzoate polyprenyltransferase
MQDQRDDAVVGVRSTARRFAAAPRRWLSLFAVLAIGFWIATGLLAPLGIGYFVLLAGIAAHLVWQIALLKPHDQADCLMRFKSNRAIGWLMLAALIVDRIH